jgi:hypothetical protein
VVRSLQPYITTLKNKQTVSSMSASNRKAKQKNLSVKPQPMDVLLGRGKSYRKHPGNVVFQGN